MLLTGSQLLHTPVMSLQTGTELAKTKEAIINPADLKIVAYEVEGPNLDQDPSLLLMSDVREFGDIGMIVDSSDEFVGSEDVIKLKPLYALHFTVVNKPVVDEHHKKIGKVEDYTVDVDSFVIQQLAVRRPLLQSLNDTELLVHRSQIVEINDDEIVIKSGELKQPEVVPQEGRHYVNPFRQTSPQPESVETNQH